MTIEAIVDAANQAIEDSQTVSLIVAGLNGPVEITDLSMDDDLVTAQTKDAFYVLRADAVSGVKVKRPYDPVAAARGLDAIFRANEE